MQHHRVQAGDEQQRQDVRGHEEGELEEIQLWVSTFTHAAPLVQHLHEQAVHVQQAPVSTEIVSGW